MYKVQEQWPFPWRYIQAPAWRLPSEPGFIKPRIGMKVRYQGKTWTIIDVLPGPSDKLVLTRGIWPFPSSVFASAAEVRPL